MKRQVSFAVLLCCILGLVSSCEKAPFLVLNSPNSLNFTDQGGSQIVSFSVNRDWTVSSSDSWCKASVSSGRKPEGVTTISITCDPNTTYDSRSTNVVIRADELMESITVTQDSNMGIIVTPSSFNISHEAQTLEINIRANIDYTISMINKDSKWISVVDTKSLSSEKIILNIAQNDSFDEREGHLNIGIKGGGLHTSVVIKQAPTPSLSVSQTKRFVSNEKQSIEIGVDSNYEYEVLSKTSWIHVVDTKSISHSTISLSVDNNDAHETRVGSIIVHQIEGKLEAEITINQSPDGTITFKDEKIKQKCIENWDTDKDGEFSYSEAAAVTSIEGAFGAIKTYSSFDELQYFTGITSIPIGMFQDWRLTSITIPESVTSVGRESFKGCFCLERVSLPSTLKQIEDSAFSGCTSLSDLTAPNGLERIGRFAFFNCSSLIEFTVPNGITIIEEGTFFGCYNLISVNLPEGLNTLSDTKLSNDYINAQHYYGGCFANCSSLRSINIPKSVTSIGSYAFRNCSSLKSIILPEGLPEIKPGTFAGCTQLESINIPGSVSLISYSNELYRNYYEGSFEGCDKLSNVVIPSNVVLIGERAFSRCSSISEVVLPNTVKEIEDHAFYGCSSMTLLTLPSNLESIGTGAFSKCSSLREVSIPDSVSKLEWSTFSYCSGLTKVSIPESVIYIGTTCFANCSSLESIIIPSSVLSIHGGAFYNCTKLSSVVFSNGIQRFEGTNNNSGVGKGYGCFENCSDLRTINLPESVKYIGWHCFNNCHNLKSLYISATTPPDLYDKTALALTNDCPIYVPSESFDIYKAAHNWYYFADRIQTIPE